MLRHGVRPSDDPRWERLAQRLMEEAEAEECSVAEFYAGLCAIMDAVDDRLSVARSELADDETETDQDEDGEISEDGDGDD